MLETALSPVADSPVADEPLAESGHVAAGGAAGGGPSLAERRLRESEEQFRQIAENVDAVLFVVDPETGRLFYVSPAYERIFGRTCSSLYDDPRSFLDAIHADDRAAVEAMISDPVRNGEIEYRVVRPDGSVRWVRDRVFPVRDEAGRVVRITGIAEDVTDDKATEAALRESGDRYQALFDATFDAVVMHADGVVIQLNSRFCELFGFTPEDLMARDGLALMVPAESRAMVDAHIAGGMRSCYEVTLRKKDGTTFPAEIRGQTIEFKGRPVRVASIRDLTERKAAEEAQRALAAQAEESQRLEALGRLAGGIAHDFNNLLTVVLNYAESAERKFESDAAAARHDLSEVVNSAERGARLVDQLLSFASRQSARPKQFTLDALIGGVREMLGRLLGEGIEVICPQEAGLWPALADPGQLEQVVMNLALNARDAMPNGGTLTLESYNVEFGPDDPARPVELPPGRYVGLTVSDTGVGMDEQVRRHAFEPFFTTKGPGRGTGLGLSICYGIVRQSGGHISLRSRAGDGSSFEIYLPAANAAAAAPARAEASPSPVGGTETVLLAEDETLIRVSAAQAMRSLGYHVIEAGDGVGALDAARAHGRALDLLVTDVGMPRMGGPELARRLREERPGLKVVFCSGYGEAVAAEATGPGAAFLRKPFRLHHLAACVRRLLDERA